MPTHDDMKREGAKDELKGKAREAWGKLTDDEGQEIRGKVEQGWGKAQRELGEILDEDEEEK